MDGLKPVIPAEVGIQIGVTRLGAGSRYEIAALRSQ